MAGDPPFNKILIANRGEIAVRVIRAAKEMGIKTVAVYSDADRDALHVLMADEAVRIGAPPPAESYLKIENVVDAALKSGAEAVHPGYGFLSENPEFAEAVSEAGITFIGPPPRVQRLVGHKLDTRRFFSSKGVPVVPGTLEPLTADDAISAAESLGYPVIVKPAGGGGGIGMTIAWNEKELVDAVKRASSIAKSAFGMGEVYVEKYFPRARHIEVQILGDTKGNIVHLYERECSVQRRFQKVVEETPSPALTEELRERVTGYAVRAAKAVGYVNAGTFEFLFDPDSQEFYLLEVNSRIQVEHPITEMITGIDIVKEQISIAAGERISFRQEEVRPKGHAFEARVYAEDPFNSFAPSPGQIKTLVEPHGPWVRVDSGVYEGFEVPPFYDPLLFKLIVWGRNREEARKRMIRALGETIVEGVKTNIPLHLAIFSDPGFTSGNYTTRFLEENLDALLRRAPRQPARRIPKKVREEAPKHVASGGAKSAEVDAWKLASRMGI